MLLPFAVMLIEDESDRVFVERMYYKHRNMLWNAAYRCLRNVQRAEDVAEDAIVQAIVHIDQLRCLDDDAVRSYLYTTALHLSFNILKREKRLIIAAEPLQDAKDEAHSVEDEVLANASSQTLRQAMMQLNEADRLLLQWKYFYGWTDDEIAGYMHINKQSVRTYVMRARRRLKNMLKEVGWYE